MNGPPALGIPSPRTRAIGIPERSRSSAGQSPARWKRGSLPAGQKGELSDKQKSFLSVDAANVQMTTLSKASNRGMVGWRVLWKPTVSLPKSQSTSRISHIAQASLCDLVENDIKSLPVKDGKVTLEMGPFSFATIRFGGPKSDLPAVASLRGEAVSDKSVRLSWNPVPKAAAYLIYRSEDPAAPATAYTLAGRSVKPEFFDDWLKIGTNYYYYVASVSSANQQGGLSAQLTVATDTKNVSPPREVSGLGIVRQGPRELKVYWEKARNPMSPATMCTGARRVISRSSNGRAWPLCPPTRDSCKHGSIRGSLRPRPIFTKSSPKIGRAIARPLPWSPRPAPSRAEKSSKSKKDEN